MSQSDSDETSPQDEAEQNPAFHDQPAVGQSSAAAGKTPQAKPASEFKRLLASYLTARDTLRFRNSQELRDAVAAAYTELHAAIDALEAPVAAPGEAWDALTESFIDAFLEDYEMRGEDEGGRDACYAPTDNDKALIKDAVLGLLHDAEEQAGSHAPQVQAPEHYTPGKWFKPKSSDELQAFFLARLPAIREAAREHGYAIGVHGSLRRDFDLIAVPWREGAVNPDVLAHATAMAACGMTRAGSYAWEKKPAGRVATSVPICWSWTPGTPGLGHIDLSVMPAQAPAQGLTETDCLMLNQGIEMLQCLAADQKSKGNDSAASSAECSASAIQRLAAAAASQPAAQALTNAAHDVLAERRRQVEAEGWTPEHDDEHKGGGMAFAAAAYAVHADAGPDLTITLWRWTGWAPKWLKPKDRRANLVRSGALIVAEIERLDRTGGIGRDTGKGGNA